MGAFHFNAPIQNLNEREHMGYWCVRTVRQTWARWINDVNLLKAAPMFTYAQILKPTISDKYALSLSLGEIS